MSASTSRASLIPAAESSSAVALSGIAQGRMIRDGTITSAALVEAHLARIEEVNPALNAVAELLTGSARQAARESDARRAAGALLSPIDGVPFSIKDSIQVAGTVCTAGTVGLRHAPPSARDATLVARLRAAGAIPLARTNLPDLLFAFESDNLLRGRTNNPYDLTRTPGGSSGGEAALIAACGSPFGLGSDAAGSVRLPAHFCGIAALKPTYGRLARTGHVPPAGGWIESIWQIGPMARRVADLRALMPLLVGGDGEDHTALDMPYAEGVPDPARVAYFTDNGIAAPDAETAATVRAAAAILGAEECRPPVIEQSYDLEMGLIGADGGDGLRAYLANIGSTETHPLLEGWLAKLEPYRTSVAGFAELWRSLYQFRAAMHAFMRSYDAILSPVCATPALPHGASIEERNFRGFSYTMTYNMLGWPAAVVRFGQSPEGLPIGVQIACKPWQDGLALALAQRLEERFFGLY
jgi:amidase